MEYRFNRTGPERKTLVTAIGEITGSSPAYMGAPSFGYEIANCTIDKEGTLIFDERTEQAEVHSLLEALAGLGFIPAEAFEEETSPDTFSIEFPLVGFTNTALSNLEKLVASKAPLIKKAIAAEDLPIVQAEDRLCFPWFSAEASADEMNAYAKFICALCEMAKNQKRVTAVNKPVASERYAMRCFLLRLGFIGPEFAAARKILLANLSGNSSHAGKIEEGRGDE
jgi:hypothetical protein